MASVCALCKEKKKLRKSHLIPSFVGKWLKNTSGTGFLGVEVEPDLRLQDFRKIPLLCENCEQKISALETYFANNIFHPFFKNEKREFDYDSRLIQFIISLNWRSLIVSYDEFVNASPHLAEYVDKAEESWRAFLLGKSREMEAYEHHLFFFDYLKNGGNVSRGFQWYTLRAADATLVGNDEMVFAYSKFPWMIFISSIYPTQLKGFEKTKIDVSGKISQPQAINDGAFGDFLLSRAKLVVKDDTIKSAKVDKRILKTIKKNPKRFLKSETLKVSLQNAKLRRAEKKKKLPKSIQELIWIVEEGIDDPNLPEAERQLRKFGLSILADAIARISDEVANDLDYKLRFTILKARQTGEDAEFFFETSEFVIVFIITLYCTKEQQRELVAKKLELLLKDKSKDDKRHFMVTSFNPFEVDLPYESAFYISRNKPSKIS